MEQDGEDILIHLLEEGSDEPATMEDENLQALDKDEFLKILNFNNAEEVEPANEEVNTDQNISTEKLVKKYRCNACGNYFRFINRHLETHGPHNCLDCLMNFPTKALYDDHVTTVHNVDTNCYICEDCSEGFPSHTTLALHRYKHTKKYTCPLCNFTVKGRYKNSLVNHIKRHEGKYAVKCDICGQGFVEKQFLATHMEMHEAIPKYECEFCKKKFTVKRYMEVHKAYNHKKELYGIEEMFQCEVCGRKFTFEKSLIRHLSCIHKIGEDRTVECQVCHKVIANNHNLKKHMRTHTGEKRFCCDFCGKAFSERKYLEKHQARHTREKMKLAAIPQEVQNNEDNNFSLIREDSIQLLDNSLSYLIKAEDDVDEDNEDLIYFTV